jgi:hypothetical protein
MTHVAVELEERPAPAKKKARLHFFKRAAEEPKAATLPQAPTQALVGRPEAKPEPVKTGEQRKMDKIQQKRRLFTRKTGE